jgi:cation diffusion facilitator CzcD-associated flavoprotein CzcO
MHRRERGTAGPLDQNKARSSKNYHRTKNLLAGDPVTEYPMTFELVSQRSGCFYYGTSFILDPNHPLILLPILVSYSLSHMRGSAPLPTLSHLGLQQFPDAADVDAPKIASEWFQAFSSRLTSGDINGVLDLFIEHCYWRDLLAFTWDFRTFDGPATIKEFLTQRSTYTQPSNFKIKHDQLFGYQHAAPDLAWIQSSFEFETKVGKGFGIFRLVPLPTDEWKAHCIFTNLEELKGFPEQTGDLRAGAPNHGKWLSGRQQEVAFANEDPTVLIVGGGQSGLDVAARLKYLGVKALIIERNPRIGDNWRNRYDALCLHDRVWYDHLPYIPFPSTWPVYTPALKLANWLESYAESLELNVWTSSTVVTASQSEATKKWDVVVKRGDGSERTFTVNHFIIATGFAGKPYMPTVPGADKFHGQILHSTQHKRASDHAGKKVAVVGSCTAAHDICTDYADNGVDVTMIQRNPTYIMTTKNGFEVIHKGLYEENGPPTELADRLDASFSRLMSLPLYQRKTKAVAEADRELLDGLAKAGFKTSMGQSDAGFLIYVWERAGGYYLDVGASQYLIEGKVKLKSDGYIDSFTETGLKFKDGSEFACDVVVFATGLGSGRELIRDICGDEVAKKCGPIWGLDDEGEIQGVCRDIGLQGFWCMMGNLCFCRFHSKHLALQIKAMEEGLFGTRYSNV